MLESSNQSTGSQRSRSSHHRPASPQPSDPRRQRAARRTPAANARPGWQRLLFGSPPRDRSRPNPANLPARLPRSVPPARVEPSRGELPPANAQRRDPRFDQRPDGSRLRQLSTPSRSVKPRPPSPAAGRNAQAEVRSLHPRQRPDSRPASPGRSRPPQRPVAPPSSRRPPRPEARPQRPVSPLMHVVRLLILGVGVGAIAGTALSVWKPNLRHPPVAAQTASPSGVSSLEQRATPSSLGAFSAILGRGRELTVMATRITPLLQGLTDLTPGLFLIDLDNGNYYSLNGTTSFSAASMIKVPILIACFQDVDAGKLRLDDLLTIQQTDLASGSGEMQYDGVGTQYSVLEVMDKMITNSDNTATNMLIRRLGGLETLNQRFQQWGLQQTRLRNLLPDLEGTNTTTPKELVMLLSLLSQGELVSMKSRDRLFDIMRHTVNDSLLPSAMGQGVTVAHKTGDIGSLVGDTGLVDMANGKRFAIAVMVKRPNNDGRANDLVRQLAATVYEYLANPNGASLPGPAAAPVSPAPSAAPTAPAAPQPTDGVSSPPSAAPSDSPTPGYEAVPPYEGLDSPAPSLAEPAPAQPDATTDSAPAETPAADGVSSPEAVNPEAVEPEGIPDASTPDALSPLTRGLTR